MLRAVVEPVHAARGSPADIPNALAGPARDGEQILLAEIDLAEVVRGKFDLDVVGTTRAPAPADV